MQLSFQDKEHFFHDTAQLLKSGIPLQRALESLGGGRDRAARGIAPSAGDGLAAAMAAGEFSPLDTGIVAAGEQSGRLEEACAELADYYAQMAKGRRRAIAAAAYPVFILHLGAVLLSIPSAIGEGSFGGFLFGVGTFLGAAYLAAVLVALALAAMARTFRSSAAADAAISMVPVVGGFLRCAALARFCLVLAMGVRSGEGFLAGIARAGNSSGSARLDEASAAAVTAIRAGAGFAEALGATRCFPADLERAFRTAETSGRLDAEISRWAGIYRERLFARIEAISVWLPRALYLLIVLLVVLRMFALIARVSGAYSQVLEM